MIRSATIALPVGRLTTLCGRVCVDTTGGWQIEWLVKNVLLVSAPLQVVGSQRQITNRAPFQAKAASAPPQPATNDVIFCQVLNPWLIRDLDYNLVRYRYQ